MTDKEKIAIKALNAAGMSLTDISAQLSISRNTVKSFLKRNKTEDLCLNCGTVLTHIPHKKRRNSVPINAVCTTGMYTKTKCRIPMPLLLNVKFAERTF